MLTVKIPAPEKLERDIEALKELISQETDPKSLEIFEKTLQLFEEELKNLR